MVLKNFSCISGRQRVPARNNGRDQPGGRKLASSATDGPAAVGADLDAIDGDQRAAAQATTLREEDRPLHTAAGPAEYQWKGRSVEGEAHELSRVWMRKVSFPRF